MPEAATSKPGWTTVAFGDVARQLKNKVDPEYSGLDRYVAGEHMDTDDLRIRRWGEIGDGYLGPAFHMQFKPGDVLYGSRRTYLRKVAVADFAGVTANTTYVLESTDRDVLLPELLPFIMQSRPFIDHSIRESKGSVNPYINFSDLEWYEFKLPPPPVQRRLLNVLTAAESKYQSLRDLQHSLGIATTSLLDAVFDPFATREILKSKLDVLPSDWTTLGSIAPLQAGFAFKSSGFVEVGDRLLRGSNVAVDSTSWSSDTTRFWPSEQRDEYSNFVLRDDDVVIAMDRPFITAGFKVARLTESDLPALLLQRVGRFLSHDSRTRDVVWACLHSRAFQYQLLSKQEGTDLPHISKAQIDGALVQRQALEQVEQTGHFNVAWRQSVNLRNRVEEAAEVKRALIQGVLT